MIRKAEKRRFVLVTFSYWVMAGDTLSFALSQSMPLAIDFVNKFMPNLSEPPQPYMEVQ
jgi:hypothetical protein